MACKTLCDLSLAPSLTSFFTAASLGSVTVSLTGHLATPQTYQAGSYHSVAVGSPPGLHRPISAQMAPPSEAITGLHFIIFVALITIRNDDMSLH